MKPLKFAALWLALGWGYAATIIYLSLTSLPHSGVEIPFLDKWAHLLAYGGLMGWFMQIYDQPKPRWIHLGLFLVMGAGLEVLQGLGGIRTAEWADMIANTGGIALGWWVGQKVKIPLK